MEKVKVDRLTVEGRDYVPADSVQPIEGDIKIVILQRGWVMIGYFSREGDDCKLQKAAVIRKWGTSAGLPELCNGKLPNTVLDKCGGVVEFDYLTVIATIAVKEEVWAREL